MTAKGALSRLRGIGEIACAVAMNFALAALQPADASAQGMAVPGEASVSETGAARYNIPIAVPPGTAGMVPSLSLSYNSQAGNGLLGTGFTLEGLAAIGRCPRTQATDGARGSVNYDADDRFCLDGQRLIAISGTNGADGTEYRTEIESFAKVISRGTAGTGPAWFEVWTKSGQRMQFGNTTDSRILAQGKTSARSWAVNRVADTKGNYYTVSYVNDAANGEAYPSRIDYTGNTGASLAPYNSVRFVYESRPDSSTAYHAGSIMKSTVRLSKVQTYANTTLVSDYRLTYAQGTTTGRSQLTSVTICGGASSCLPATSFSWLHGNTNYSVVTNVAAQDGTLVSHVPIPGDYNGDGQLDVLWDLRNSSGRQLGTRVLWFSNAAGGFNIVGNPGGLDGTLVASRTYQNFGGDYDRDGNADILWDLTQDSPPASGGTRVLWRSNGVQGFTAINNVAGQDGTLSHYAPTVGDFNGDGRTDVLWDLLRNSQGYQAGTRVLWLSNGAGTFSIVANPGGLDGTLIGDRRYLGFTGDFNADGKTDILWDLTEDSPRRSMGTRVLWLSTGTGFTAISNAGGQDGTVGGYAPTLGDFNGDGLTDVLWDQINSQGRQAGNRVLWTGKGDGNFVVVNNPGGLNGTLVGARTYYGSLLDYNGDGYTDILWDHTQDSPPGSIGTRVLWLSNGNGGFASVANVAGQDGTLVAYSPISGDVNGDGIPDVLWDKKANSVGSSAGLRALWLSDSQPRDLIRAVTNGLGFSSTFTFGSMSKPELYTKDTSATDPVVDMKTPLWLVSSLDHDNGLGSTRKTRYQYAGAKVHLDGRGFLGFRNVIATDAQTGVVQSTVYRQDFPLTGIVSEEAQSKAGVTLSRTTNSHDAIDLGAPRTKVHLTQSTSSGADLDGTALPSSTTTYQYDEYGNATQITVSNSDGFSKTTTNSYSNDPANWLLGRLNGATVASQAPTFAQQTPPPLDRTPNTFDFTDVGNAPLSTLHETSAAVSGFTGVLSVSVTGGDAAIRKNGIGAWSASAGIQPGDTLNIRMTSSAAYNAARTAVLMLGTLSVNWVITTLHDTTPDAFDFADLTNVPTSTLYETSAVISGFTGTLSASVTGAGAQIRKNATGSWGTSVAMSPGDALNLRMTSAATNLAAVTAVVTVGSTSLDWKITTVAPPCAGALVGGFCWYLSAAGQSCDTACSARSGCNLVGTRDYAGSGGTLQGCQAVINALGITATAQDVQGNGVNPLGCYTRSNEYFRITNHETTCGYSLSGRSRFCSCNN